MVVDYDGRILAQADAGPGEKVVVAPINIDQLRAERERRIGHDLRAHLRSNVHNYLNRDYLPAAGNEPISIESLKNRISKARQRLHD